MPASLAMPRASHRTTPHHPIQPSRAFFHPPQKKPLCPFPPCSKLGAVVFNRKPSGPELPSLLSPVLWLLLRVQAFLCRRQPKTPDAPCTQEQAIAWLQHMLQAIDDFAQSAKNGTLPPLTPSAAPAPTTPSPPQDLASPASAPGAGGAGSTPPGREPGPPPGPPPIRARNPHRAAPRRQSAAATRPPAAPPKPRRHPSPPAKPASAFPDPTRKIHSGIKTAKLGQCLTTPISFRLSNKNPR
jgi:hypothetical protein